MTHCWSYPYPSARRRPTAIDLGIRGKAVIITGGGSGIGRATALLLADEGARVALLDCNEQRTKEVAEEIAARGGTALPIICDVSEAAAVEDAVSTVSKQWERVDVLVNCAGVLLGKPFLKSGPEDWRREIDICLVGVLNLCRSVLPVMTEKGGGRIVSVASDAGRVGEPSMSTYAAAKAGIIAFSKSIAKEFGPAKVNVNVVCPGSTRTPMLEEFLTPEAETKWVKAYPLRRLGEPDDIAPMLVFLVSERADWITGQTISVNGGYSMV